MRYLALALSLILSLSACSVEKVTERNSGIGFKPYDVPAS